MTADLATTLAFAYRRRGVAAMERSKLLHLLAFDLRWFSPDPAKRVLQRGLDAGLLEMRGDELALTFDAASVDVPLNYRPPEDLADQTGAVDMPRLATAAPDDEALAERARRGGLVTLEVAALLARHRRGEDVREAARELEGRLTAGGQGRA